MSHDKKTTAGVAAVVVFTLLGGIGMFFHTRSIPPLWLLDVYQSPIRSIGLSPDGSRALVASSDTAAREAVKLVDLGRRKVLGSVSGWYGAMAVGFLASESQKERFAAVFANRICTLNKDFHTGNTALVWRDELSMPVTSPGQQVCSRIDIREAYFVSNALVLLTTQNEILYSNDGLQFISWGKGFQELLCGLTRCVAQDVKKELVWISIPDGKRYLIDKFPSEYRLTHLAENGPLLLLIDHKGQVHRVLNNNYNPPLPLQPVKTLAFSRNGSQMLAINAAGSYLLAYSYPELKFKAQQKSTDLRILLRQPNSDQIIYASGGTIGSVSFK